MKKELESIFYILETGNQQDVIIAKKRIHTLHKENRNLFKKHVSIALKHMEKFDTIISVKNQEYFLSGLNLFLSYLADTHFEECKKFILKVMCHPNGSVREKMRKAADWLFIYFTSNINPFVWPPNKTLSARQIAQQEKVKKEYIAYLHDIESLLKEYDHKSYHTVEYINELKPSVYKSLQLLWSDVTRGNIYRNLHTPPLEILLKREQIEKALKLLIEKTKSEISLEEIKIVIFEENSFDDLSETIELFKYSSPDELNTLLEILNNAWNYFPHRILNGRCPAEIFFQNQEKRVMN